jgi:hypothetical protein
MNSVRRLLSTPWTIGIMVVLRANSFGQDSGEPHAIPPGGFETPRAAFEAAAEAERKGDWGAEFDVYLPDDRNLVLARTVSLCELSLAGSDRDPGGELGELLKKAGAKLDSKGLAAFEDAELAAEAFASVNDARALWVSLRTWFEKHASPHEPSRFLGKLGEISDHGETASGVVDLVRGGQTVLWFQRVGKRWFVSPGAPRERINRELCRQALREIAKRVHRFWSEQHRWPRNLGELVIRPDDVKDWPEGGYLPSIAKDPWGGEFMLVVPGRDGTEFEVFAYGRDRKPGGEGVNLDSVESFEKPAPEKE